MRLFTTMGTNRYKSLLIEQITSLEVYKILISK